MNVDAGIAPSTPASAATILVVRDAGGEAEVLLLQRQPKLRFFGGFWVFPGGRVDAADASVPTPADARVNEAPLATAVAACRELFEETGLLLVANADGSAADRIAVDELRRRCHNQTPPVLFGEMLRQAMLQVDVGRLIYWAHWITPSAVPTRFDTRFFVVRVPAGEALDVAAGETSEARWIAVRDWKTLPDTEGFLLTPPTLLVLREFAEALHSHGSLDALLNLERRRKVYPVVPKLVGTGEDAVVVLPWDSQYASTSGEGIPWDASAIATRTHWPSRLPPRIGRSRSGTLGLAPPTSPPRSLS